MARDRLRSTITQEGDQLRARHTGQALAVFSVGKDRFDYDADLAVASLTFERDAAGKITAAVLHHNGQEIRAPRL